MVRWRQSGASGWIATRHCSSSTCRWRCSTGSTRDVPMSIRMPRHHRGAGLRLSRRPSPGHPCPPCRGPPRLAAASRCPGYPPMACAVERPDEAVFVKRSSSAFATTTLEAHLRGRGSRIFMSWGRGGVLRQLDGARGLRPGVSRDGGTRRGDRVRPALRRVGRGVIFDVTMGLLAADFAEVVDGEAVLAGL